MPGLSFIGSFGNPWSDPQQILQREEQDSLARARKAATVQGGQHVALAQNQQRLALAEQLRNLDRTNMPPAARAIADAVYDQLTSDTTGQPTSGLGAAISAAQPTQAELTARTRENLAFTNAEDVKKQAAIEAERTKGELSVEGVRGRNAMALENRRGMFDLTKTGIGAVGKVLSSAFRPTPESVFEKAMERFEAEAKQLNFTPTELTKYRLLKQNAADILAQMGALGDVADKTALVALLVPIQAELNKMREAAILRQSQPAKPEGGAGEPPPKNVAGLGNSLETPYYIEPSPQTPAVGQGQGTSGTIRVKSNATGKIFLIPADKFNAALMTRID